MEIFLHEKQAILDQDDHRFQVVAAGRRFGKSFFAAYKLYQAAAQTEKVRSDGSVVDITGEVVYYVAPTFKQGRETLWQMMMDFGHQAGVIDGIRANEGEIRLTNGRIIRFKGADDPDSLRGVGVSYVVLDEYAFMKAGVWEYVIRPMLMLSEGGGLFIGTPAGKNHFYDMWLAAKEGIDPMTATETDEWAAFQFRSADNPHYTEKELESIVVGLSEEARRQELEASFEATGGRVFTMDMFPVVKWDGGGAATVIAVDLAGFSKIDRKGAVDILDDHAIVIALIHDRGWHIQQILHGKWDVRGTALKIIRAWRSNG